MNLKKKKKKNYKQKYTTINRQKFLSKNHISQQECIESKISK